MKIKFYQKPDSQLVMSMCQWTGLQSPRDEADLCAYPCSFRGENFFIFWIREISPFIREINSANPILMARENFFKRCESNLSL
jgi:hypothetical protein